MKQNIQSFSLDPPPPSDSSANLISPVRKKKKKKDPKVFDESSRDFATREKISVYTSTVSSRAKKQSPKTASTRTSKSTPHRKPDSYYDLPSTTASEDQYEDPDEFDEDDEEDFDQFSDNSSYFPNTRYQRCNPPLNGAQSTGSSKMNTARPYRKLSFTTSSSTPNSPTVAKLSSPNLASDEPNSPQKVVPSSQNSSISNKTISLQNSVSTIMPSPAPPDIASNNITCLNETATDPPISESDPVHTTSSVVPHSENLKAVSKTINELSSDALNLLGATSQYSPEISPSVEHKPPLTPSNWKQNTSTPKSMTVETETVVAPPSLALLPNNGTIGLKVKKSIDNVNKLSQKTKKKKTLNSTRPGGSKVQVFAAKIASAVDEVQSSDSDETFVYESNPNEPNPHLINPSASSSSMRPRFHGRSPSTSSMSAQPFPPQHQQRPSTPVQLSQPEVQQQAISGGTDSYQTLTQSRRSNAQRHYQQQLLDQQLQQIQQQQPHQQQQLLQLQQQSIKEVDSDSNSLNAKPSSTSQFINNSINKQTLHHQHSHSSFYSTKNYQEPSNDSIDPHHQSNMLMQVSDSTPALVNTTESVSNTNSPGTYSSGYVPGASVSSFPMLHKSISSNMRSQLKSGRSYKLSVSKRALQNSNQLRSKQPSGLIDYKPGNQSFRRINSRYSNYEDGDEEEELYNEDDDDFDDDDDDDYYYDYSEATPFRVAMNNKQSQGNTNYGSLSGPSGRRAWKNHLHSNYNTSNSNSGSRAYSPHNYKRYGSDSEENNTRFHRLHFTLWIIFAILTILCLGFVMGFLLATTKPLHNVAIAEVFDILVSDEELIFDVVVEGINPGFLSVEISTVDMDVFARSKYVQEDSSSEDGYTGEPHTMLLGNIQHFEVPLSFEGGVLSRRLLKSVGQFRLVHPGRNTTSSHDDDNDDGDDNDRLEMVFPTEQNSNSPSSGGSDLDYGQKKWARVNLHPFELIVRGVMKYDLLLSPNKVASISKVCFSVLFQTNFSFTNCKNKNYLLQIDCTC